MKYRSSYKGLQQRNTRSGSRSGGKINVRLWAMGVGFVVLFAGSMFLFRNTKHEKPVTASNVVSNVDSTAAIPTSLSNPDATLIGVSSNKPVGTATRTISNALFHVSMHATLPGIDRASQFYEAWLVRPVPYDYVSAGEMVTNDLGSFVLDWNGASDKDYSGYTDLVITLQARNGDTYPQTHIVEGEFGTR